MSQFWKDGEELAKAVVGMYDKIREDEEVVQKTSKLNTMVVYKYTDPDAQIWWNTKGGRFEYGSGEPPEKFDVRMSLSGDDAHRAWSNKLNAVMAITRKKIKVEGSVTQLMKLASLQKRFAVAYSNTLKEMGEEDILL